MSIARQRLAAERKALRKDRPYGFFAAPKKTADGGLDLMHWKCCVPGKPGTIFEGGSFPLQMNFDEEYPSKPPKCFLPRDFFHPNVYDDGEVCLSIIDPNGNWKPAISIKEILLGIQALFDTPNPDSPANYKALSSLRKNPKEYEKRIRALVVKYPSED